MSNHDGAPVEYHQYIDGSYTDADGQEKVGCRKPGIMDTIGVGVNLKTNTITFLLIILQTQKGLLIISHFIHSILHLI